MDTSVIACFPDADPLVERWRIKFDPWAAHGIGAHATVASPFLDDDRIDAGVVARASDIAARHSVVISFNTIDVLPGAIALCPAATDSLIALTADIVTAWPEITARLRTGRARPYHLTVACSTDDAVRNEITSGIASKLPAQFRATRLDIVAHEPAQVRVVAAIPLGGEIPRP
jgi:hypothetical protein